MDNHQSVISIKVNGIDRTLVVRNNRTLLDVLRDDLGVPGGKCG